MNLEILYEDNHLLALNKPAGMLSQRDISGKDSILEHGKSYIKEKYGKPGNVFLGTVHRLDRPVTGAIVMARTSKAADRLTGQFKGRDVTKIYLALVRTGTGGTDLPEDWTLLRQLVKRDGDVTVVTECAEGSREAVLEYRTIRRDDNRALLLVRLRTGRKHQIRAQLASLGMPVEGDGKYGSTAMMSDGSICLHALYLRFEHPTRQEDVEITAGVPRAFSDAWGAALPAREIVEEYIIRPAVP
jgi:23S rRNA pseudouridine1911/1915/1917 synthase